MSSYTPRSYETARAVFSILEFVAWTAVVVGIIVAFAGASATGSSFGRNPGLGVLFLAALPGIALSVVGLIAAAIVQSSRAGADAAEMTGHMLKIAEEQLKVSKEANKASYSPSTSFDQSGSSSRKPTPLPPGSQQTTDRPAATATSFDRAVAQSVEPTVSAKASTLGAIEYRGLTIRRTGEGFQVGDLTFPALGPARAYIEDYLSKADQTESSQHSKDR
jgi:hypothetical protein